MIKVVLLLFLFDPQSGAVEQVFTINDGELPGFDTMATCEEARTYLLKQRVPEGMKTWSKCVFPSALTT